jgi:hypothetical protein
VIRYSQVLFICSSAQTYFNAIIKIEKRSKGVSFQVQVQSWT